MPQKSLIILGALLIILATDSTAFAQTAFAQSEGDRYVLRALNMLLTVNTIESDIRIETYVDGREHIARGRYEEQALPRTLGQPPLFLRSMFRLEIFFSPIAGNSEPNRMTLVCRPRTDGASVSGARGQVERYTSIEGFRTFETIDLAMLEERILNSRTVTFAHISEVRYLGGLAGMIRQISRYYEFSLPTQENLQDGGTIPALKLTGRLRGEHYDRLLSQFGGLDARGHSPADFPSNIELWLGRHNDFPYKIRYLRRISGESERKELLLQESFFNVILNGTPIPSSRFDPLIPPEDIFGTDNTENFIWRLGL